MYLHCPDGIEYGSASFRLAALWDGRFCASLEQANMAIWESWPEEEDLATVIALAQADRLPAHDIFPS